MTKINDLASVQQHFDQLAPQYDAFKRKNTYYHQTLKEVVRRTVRPGSRVLEIGCATGDMLHASEPAYGVGVDLSGAMIAIARQKFPQYHFHHTSFEDFTCEETFDFIIMTDVINHVHDVMEIFRKIRRLCHPQTKIVVTMVNPWWDPLFRMAEKRGWKAPDLPLNYLDRRNIGKILELVDFKLSETACLLLCPVYIPVLAEIANSVGVRIGVLNMLSFAFYMVIHPRPENTTDLGFGCSVVIPCYNEEGNIAEAIRRIPRMGKRTEIIVVNDGSKDQTAERVRELQSQIPDLKLIDYSPNRGKGFAVKTGFDAAEEEIMMILDADMTVDPDELPRFFEPLNSGSAQFVNGTRMVYPQEGQSMRFLNQLGNKLFSLFLTFIVNQHLTDTLCGTKALYRKDYARIPMGKDKWGDFDLLFGAARACNKIVEVPVHYKKRKAGASKMKSFQHGLHLLSVCLWGIGYLTFNPSKKS